MTDGTVNDSEKSGGKRYGVPIGDPYVRDRAHGDATRRSVPEREPHQTYRRREEKRTPFAFRKRRRDTLLGLLFGALALLIFAFTRAAPPRVIVNLSGGEGTVVIDGREVGRTGLLYSHLPMKMHTIRVLPDDPRQVIKPDSVRVMLKYNLHPVQVLFHVVTGADTLHPPPDSGRP